MPVAQVCRQARAVVDTRLVVAEDIMHPSSNLGTHPSALRPTAEAYKAAIKTEGSKCPTKARLLWVPAALRSLMLPQEPRTWPPCIWCPECKDNPMDIIWDPNM